MIHRPIPCRITSIVDEAIDRKTITVKAPEIAEKALPGQFIMVWIIGVDEIPMGISHIGGDEISFTAHRIGDATTALHEKRVGDIIGVRGPYGNGFKITGRKPLIIGGGTGMAPLMPLIEKMIEMEMDVTVINGAKTKRELLFLKKLQNWHVEGKIKLIVTTDDGTYGIRAMASDIVEQVIKNKGVDEVYVCGPEKMMVKIFNITERMNVHLQASLERYMKCAIGICGSCTLDPLGLRVCRDGPVFPSEVLRSISEFGRYRRNASGIKEAI